MSFEKELLSLKLGFGQGNLVTLRKQQRNGKQVYQLGAATIQLDKNLIYVAPKGEGEWKAPTLISVMFSQHSTR